MALGAPIDTYFLVTNFNQKPGKLSVNPFFIPGDLRPVEKEHCYANCTARGDLSSIKWIEGPLTKKVEPQARQRLVEVIASQKNLQPANTILFTGLLLLVELPGCHAGIRQNQRGCCG